MPVHPVQGQKILRDTIIITFSLILTILLARDQNVILFFQNFSRYPWLGAFVAGIFLVSQFTAIPATVVLAGLSLHSSLPVIALSAAFGSAVGDIGIFSFFKTTIVDDLRYLFGKFHLEKYVYRIYNGRYRVVLIVLGVLLWILPLPDEIPLAILGVTKTNNKLFLLLSLVINFCTAAIIWLVARAIV